MSDENYCPATLAAHNGWSARGQHDAEVMKAKDDLLGMALEILDMARLYLRSGTDDLKSTNDLREAIQQHLGV